MLTKIDECQTASEVVKSVNILVAIRWVAQAWSIVSTQTISKCFRKACILNSEMDIVSCSMEEDDPFSAVNVEADLTSLIHDVVPNCCSSDEYSGRYQNISRKSRSLNGVNQDWICGFIGFITTVLLHAIFFYISQF